MTCMVEPACMKCTACGSGRTFRFKASTESAYFLMAPSSPFRGRGMLCTGQYELTCHIAGTFQHCAVFKAQKGLRKGTGEAHLHAFQKVSVGLLLLFEGLHDDVVLG